jgi:hypothetical protein
MGNEINGAHLLALTVIGAAIVQLFALAGSKFIAEQRLRVFKRYFAEARSAGAEEHFMRLVTQRARIGASLREVVQSWTIADYSRFCTEAQASRRAIDD